MESDDFTNHYIIRYLSACELVLPPPWFYTIKAKCKATPQRTQYVNLFPRQQKVVVERCEQHS